LEKDDLPLDASIIGVTSQPVTVIRTEADAVLEALFTQINRILKVVQFHGCQFSALANHALLSAFADSDYSAFMTKTIPLEHFGIRILEFVGKSVSSNKRQLKKSFTRGICNEQGSTLHLSDNFGHEFQLVRDGPVAKLHEIKLKTEKQQKIKTDIPFVPRVISLPAAVQDPLVVTDRLRASSTSCTFF